MIRIIGIGSPFGDDAAGLEVARMLAGLPPPNCEVLAADRPGAMLVDLLEGADAVILIDAVRSGAPPGTIHEFTFDELDRCATRLVSSHDLGVAAAIGLAHKLGRAPAVGTVIGIEIASATTARLGGLSAGTREAACRATERVRSAAVDFDDRERERLNLAGTVQGVGLRPFVWRLAKSLRLTGFVRNILSGVEIEVEGNRAQLRAFRRRLQAELPGAAAIDRIESERCPLRNDSDFSAMQSERGRAATTIPPDLATCAECVREILDPGNRRYRYPFTNCTSCGPRFTVVRALPYDRESTTLRDFPLCGQCGREYLDPSNRRFRAEPTACPECGPKAWLEVRAPRWDSAGAGGDCVGRAAAILRAGGIVALQGIGGVHLACDAGSEVAVARLRTIKQRLHKPFAVMVDSIETARSFADISDDEAALLTSPPAAIVLLRRRPGVQLASAIAPGNDHVGVMIAYSPLHHLIMRDAARPLVMTSANRPGEPLARDGDEVRAVFGDKVDALLLHNRPIHQRCDDGVWIVTPRGPQPVRLSRGSTPRPLRVSVVARVPILGVGGDSKNNFCILRDGDALMSQYIGTLESTATQDHFRDSLEKWIAMSGVAPRIVAHDLHPHSFGREIATRLGVRSMGVQHHYAHVAACMVDNGHTLPVIGIAFDGTGYGLDGAIWGGEAIIADYQDFRRVSHFQYLPLAGGDAAIRHPARIAAAFMFALFGSECDDRASRLVGEERARIVATMVGRGINTVRTSSCGRLFDAVAALLGVRSEITYEGQAAIELETLARSSMSANHIYPFSIRDGVVHTGDILASVIAELESGMSKAKIAQAFHDTMAEVTARMALDARAKSGIDVVALSGGCFQNRLLQAAAIHRIEREGFTVLVHRRVPANDGGLALGQAIVAAARLEFE
ncbi:MAG TPA: carbamoyltransferase HypF [Candidatus Binataceae bacterium]|nr:carbamoyltransferase HypF [Candidatus Binataceae bacterium]